ncbi:hypothetical protein [Moraxella lacunata]
MVFVFIKTDFKPILNQTPKHIQAYYHDHDRPHTCLYSSDCPTA